VTPEPEPFTPRTYPGMAACPGIVMLDVMREAVFVMFVFARVALIYGTTKVS
jgi:hypothetical protein